MTVRSHSARADIGLALLLWCITASTACSEQGLSPLDEPTPTDLPELPAQDTALPSEWDDVTPDEVPDMTLAVVWSDLSQVGDLPLDIQPPGPSGWQFGLQPDDVAHHRQLDELLPRPRLSFIDLRGNVLVDVPLPEHVSNGYRDVHQLVPFGRRSVIAVVRQGPLLGDYPRDLDAHPRTYAAVLIDAESQTSKELLSWTIPARRSVEPVRLRRPDGEEADVLANPGYFQVYANPWDNDHLWLAFSADGRGYKVSQSVVAVRVALEGPLVEAEITRWQVRAPHPQVETSAVQYEVGDSALAFIDGEPWLRLRRNGWTPDGKQPDRDSVLYRIDDLLNDLAEPEVRLLRSDVVGPPMRWLPGFTLGDSAVEFQHRDGVTEWYDWENDPGRLELTVKPGQWEHGAFPVAPLDLAGPTWIHWGVPNETVHTLRSRIVLQHRQQRLVVTEGLKEGLDRKPAWIHGMVLVRD